MVVKQFVKGNEGTSRRVATTHYLRDVDSIRLDSNSDLHVVTRSLRADVFRQRLEHVAQKMPWRRTSWETT